jgi:hypothetical protein
LVVCRHQHENRGEQRMHLHRRQSRAYAYRCDWRAAPGQKKCCGYVNAAALESAVVATLRQLATEPELLLAEYKAGLDRYQMWYRQWKQRLATAEAQIALAQTMLDNMTLDYYAGQLPHDQYRRLQPVAEARLTAAQQTRSQLWAEREPEWRDEWADELMIQTLRQGPDYVSPDGEPPLWPGLLRELELLELGRLQSMTPDEQRQRLKTFVHKIVVDDAGASLILVGGTSDALRINGYDRLSPRCRQGSVPAMRSPPRGRPVLPQGAAGLPSPASGRGALCVLEGEGALDAVVQ